MEINDPNGPATNEYIADIVYMFCEYMKIKMKCEDVHCNLTLVYPDGSEHVVSAHALDDEIELEEK